MALVAYRWAATIVQEWGQKPSQQTGTVLGIALGFAIALLLVDYVLWRLQLSKAIRSGLWACAAIGPYAGLVAEAALAHPVWSQIAGFGTTILAFLLFYNLEQGLEGKRQR